MIRRVRRLTAPDCGAGGGGGAAGSGVGAGAPAGTIASGIRLYREFSQSLQRKEGPGQITVPTGFADYPNEIVRMPRAWCERAYPLIHWNEQPRGGHFAALEQPQLFAEDLWVFARKLREHEKK